MPTATTTCIREPRVLLVSPPWTSLNEPSLGLSLLRAVLDKEGIPCRVIHLNLFTLEFLRAKTYSALARVYALNDFVFSGLLDPDVTPRQLRLLREKCTELIALGTIDYRQYGGIPGVVEQVLRLRSEVVPLWVERKAEELIRWRPTLVGFTCMFDQTIASASISSRVKALAPDAFVVFGGYAVRSPTGEMLLDAFPWIDAVCAGEGEPCIADLARASIDPNADLSQVPNLFFRNSAGKIVESRRAKPVEMDTIPLPNFDDFYADIRRLRNESAVEVSVDRLPIENSRGCWWGAVSHCVFCGIHDDDMNYRARDAELVLQGLDELSERYGSKEFRFADYIMPYRYYTTLLPRLVERGSPYNLKCELKSNIRTEQLKLLVDAGFIEVQPGIESFCSRMLKRMDKGVSGTQNVYLLLLARRYGMVILYNILYGLPDDDPEAVEAMERALPHLVHLDPPSTRGRIQITRYAPLQADPNRFGIGPLRHEHSYELIFSEAFLEHSGFDLDRYCYIYEHPFEPPPRLARSYRRIDAQCDVWNNAYLRQEADLLYDFTNSAGFAVYDSRELPAQVHRLTADEAAVLVAAECPRTVASLKEVVAGISSASFDAALQRLDELGLLFRDDGKVLSLALPRSVVAPRKHWWDNYQTRWQEVVSTPAEVSG
jgi:ribosomal peptide maturation radical SAM protein 1